jgi:hypothetical protein
LAQNLVAPNPDRILLRTFVQSSLRSEFFTDDYLTVIATSP